MFSNIKLFLIGTQLIYHGDVDFIIYDYLSEITMSLLTAAQAKKPELGFAPDFVMDAIGPHLKQIKNKGNKFGLFLEKKTFRLILWQTEKKVEEIIERILIKK